MESSLLHIKCVKFGDVKTISQISKAEDVITKDEKVFVRASPTNTTLVNRVCETNPHAPHLLPKNMTLTRALGCKNMIKNSSVAANSELNKFSGTECSLLQPAENKKTKRLPRIASSEERKQLEVTTMELEHLCAVSGLKPVSASNGLFVEHSTESMTAVIQYLGELGFEDNNTGLHDVTFPKGIWRRGDKFIVKCTKLGGPVGYKQCKTMDEVNVFLGNVSTQASGHAQEEHANADEQVTHHAGAECASESDELSR